MANGRWQRCRTKQIASTSTVEPPSGGDGTGRGGGAPRHTDKVNEDKATRYHRLGRRAAMVSTVWTGVILAGLLFLGGSAALRDWAASIAGTSPTLTTACYILFLSVLVD